MPNLIIIPGHAVYTPREFPQPLTDKNWALQEFQRGEVRFYVEHILRGIEFTAQDEKALLVFSGGQTRAAAGRRSEAESYFALAEHYKWMGAPEIKSRAATEEYARDSLENLLFSICRFREIQGYYPGHITVVGWRFKAERFNLHRAALRLPESMFAYAGVNDPPDTEGARRGELINALTPFRRDPYGVRARGDVATDPEEIYLGNKRAARNPFNRHAPYAATCPELAGLLNYRGTEIFGGALPWENESKV